MTSLPSASNVIAATVTYGDRSNYVQKLIEAVAQCGIQKLILVDNGCPADVSARLHALCASAPIEMNHVRLPRNLGSAGGFSAAILHAVQTKGVDFIWILDDDNIPRPSAFVKLCTAFDYLGGTPDHVLSSLRLSRSEYVEAARNGGQIGIVRGTVLGFSLRSWLVGHLARTAKRLLPVRSSQSEAVNGHIQYPIVGIGHAPYGGLFFHTSWVARIGLPNEKFYLYSDDHDYTRRMLRNGGTLYLCAQSEIDDVDQPLPAVPSRVPLFMRPESDDLRVYCWVRNRIYLEMNEIVQPLSYYVNIIGVVGLMLIAALMFGVPAAVVRRRMTLLVAAVRAGAKGTFEVDENGLPVLPASRAE